VTAPNVRTASAALDAARPVVARLDVSRDPEDVAADILDAWSSSETALRAYMGGSALAGQALVRELRQREMLSHEQAHALLEFLSARDRANRPSYRPTSADVLAARDGFTRLEEAINGGAMSPAAYANQAGFSGAATGYGPPRGAAAPAAATTTSGLPPASGIAATGEVGVYEPRAEGRGPGRTIAILLGVLLLLGAGAYALLGRRAGGSSAAVEDAIALYSRGQRAPARVAFQKIAADDPSSATPHIYLGRIAREEGDMRSAQNELDMAVRLEPRNSIALREMGSYLLAANNNELARKFYVRAIQENPEDKSAQGFLGCSLMRLGRMTEAQTWLQRAGPGPWTSCTALPQPAPAAQAPVVR
jgi:tetratricopeptide (TPR) repeat protein